MNRINSASKPRPISKSSSTPIQSFGQSSMSEKYSESCLALLAFFCARGIIKAHRQLGYSLTINSVAMQLTVKKLLNAKEKHPGFVCEEIRLTDGENARIEIKLVPRKGCKGLCSCCSEPCPGYDRLPPREFIHVPIWGMPVIYLYAMRRVDCPKSGVTVEAVPWSSGKSPITKSYAWYLS